MVRSSEAFCTVCIIIRMKERKKNSAPATSLVFEGIQKLNHVQRYNRRLKRGTAQNKVNQVAFLFKSIWRVPDEKKPRGGEGGGVDSHGIAFLIKDRPRQSTAQTLFENILLYRCTDKDEKALERFWTLTPLPKRSTARGSGSQRVRRPRDEKNFYQWRLIPPGFNSTYWMKVLYGHQAKLYYCSRLWYRQRSYLKKIYKKIGRRHMLLLFLKSYQISWI